MLNLKLNVLVCGWMWLDARSWRRALDTEANNGIESIV
jgi:hypothetical protein